jgi:cytochrome c1
MDEVKGLKLWHIIAVLIFCILCTFIRAAVEPVTPPKEFQKPMTKQEVWDSWNEVPDDIVKLTDEELTALVQYLKELKNDGDKNP